MNLNPTLSAALPAVTDSLRCHTLAPNVAEACENPSYQPLSYQRFPAPFVSVDSKSLTTPQFHPQLPQNQHLRMPLASVASKRLITPADATLTQRAPPNSFISNTYKKPGGGVSCPTLLYPCSPRSITHFSLLTAYFSSIYSASSLSSHTALAEEYSMNRVSLALRRVLSIASLSALALLPAAARAQDIPVVGSQNT